MTEHVWKWQERALFQELEKESPSLEVVQHFSKLDLDWHAISTKPFQFFGEEIRLPFTPLPFRLIYKAIWKPQWQPIAQCLFDHGLRPYWEDSIREKNQKNIWDLAIRSEAWEMFPTLVKIGCSPNQVLNEEGSTPLLALFQSGRFDLLEAIQKENQLEKVPRSLEASHPEDGCFDTLGS
jgi:hypothetical protein